MMTTIQRIYSEFAPLQGLWTPGSLSECREVLDYLRLLPDVPIGVLFLCLSGMRELESWFAEGRSRPQRICKAVALDQPPTPVTGAELVDAVLMCEDREDDIHGWLQLYALVLWSELRGAEVSCLWTPQALNALQSVTTPEADFFPWTSPVWQHSLTSTERGKVRCDNAHEMALRRGLNPALIRGLASGTEPAAALDATHFARARAILLHHRAVARLSSPGARFWRLDRYFGPEGTGSSLGVAVETRRFRAGLFQWMRNSNRDTDEQLLIADALLHLRERTPAPAVSCNSFLFRWRTRHPFSYQRLTNGELYQVLSFLDRRSENAGVGNGSASHPTRASRTCPVRAEHNPIETHRFQVDLTDNQTASGTVFRVPGQTIGRELFPDIVMLPEPMRLSAIVHKYEESTSRTVIVAINGGYFLDTRTVPPDHPEWLGKPVGLLKFHDQVISGPFYTHRPVLCLDHGHRIALRFVRKGLCSLENAPLSKAYTWLDKRGEYLGFQAAIEAGPLLIKAGKLDLDLKREQWDSVSARAIQAAPVEMPDLRTMRTAIAMSKRGDVYLITVHGRVPESVGMTHNELAIWLLNKIEDVDWAMEMDAGGSVTAWHVNLGVTTMDSCTGGQERPIASSILFRV